MAEEKGSVILRWARASIVHLVLVGLSFVISFMLLRRVGLMPGEVLECMAFGFLLFYAVAAVVALLIPRASILSCCIVFALAFLPTGGCLGLQEIRKEINHRYYLPYDRFADHLASPVPKSVSNLRFVSMEEGVGTDLMFQFDIDPADLDFIMKNLNMKQVDPNNMLNPKDFFQYPYYMPIEGGYHLFQGKDKYEEVLTIKTNESHSHAVFRIESSSTYRDRRWETGNPLILQMDNEALERLKQKHEK